MNARQILNTLLNNTVIRDTLLLFKLGKCYLSDATRSAPRLIFVELVAARVQAREFSVENSVNHIANVQTFDLRITPTKFSPRRFDRDTRYNTVQEKLCVRMRVYKEGLGTPIRTSLNKKSTAWMNSQVVETNSN